MPQPSKSPVTDRNLTAAVFDGKPYVSLRHACDAIGLAYARQLDKLKSRSWAVVHMMSTTGSDGKRYDMAMIDRRGFLMWLALIDAGKVRPDIRPVVEAFQAEAADALDAHFSTGVAVRVCGGRCAGSVRNNAPTAGPHPNPVNRTKLSPNRSRQPILRPSGRKPIGAITRRPESMRPRSGISVSRP